MSDSRGISDCLGCQPITFDDSYVCVDNGKDKETCALKVNNVMGKKIVRVAKGCHEWCRLLTSKHVYERPFSNLQIWNTWDAAVEEAICQMKFKKRKHENLEEADDKEDDKIDNGTTKYQKKKIADLHPVIEVTMPMEPNSENTIAIYVESTPRRYGFEFKERNIQWLRDFILKELEMKQKH